MGTREAMRAAAQTVAETAVEGAAGMGPGSAGEAAALQDGPRAADGAAASARFFPWRFLGMGLLIAWLCCTHITAVFPGSGFDLEPRHTFDYAMRVGDVGMLLLLGLAAPRLGRLSRHRALCAVAVGLTCLGTLAGGLALIPGSAPAAALAAVGVATSLGGAVLFCLWAEIYSQMGMTRTIMYGAFSCLVAGGAAFLVCTMRPPYAIMATAVLPGLSLGCAWLSLRALPGEPVRRPSTRYAVPWKLVDIMAVAGLLSGSSGLVLGGVEGVGALFRVLATVLAAVVILAVMFVRRDRMDVRFLAKVALPLAVIALALLPFAHSAIAYLVAFLLKFAYVWYTFFVLLVLAGICYRYEVPSCASSPSPAPPARLLSFSASCCAAASRATGTWTARRSPWPSPWRASRSWGPACSCGRARSPSTATGARPGWRPRRTCTWPARASGSWPAATAWPPTPGSRPGKPKSWPLSPRASPAVRSNASCSSPRTP